MHSNGGKKTSVFLVRRMEATQSGPQRGTSKHGLVMSVLMALVVEISYMHTRML